MSKDKNPRQDCGENIHNEPGVSPDSECWLLRKAKLVIRFKLHWWTEPADPGAFENVETHDFYHEPGQFAFYKRLPDFARAAE